MGLKKLFEKGPRELAAHLKAGFCGSSSKCSDLDLVVDHLVGTLHSEPINGIDVLDWCRAIIAGDRSYHDFSNTVSSYNDSSVCGLVWNADYVAYRCRTCAKTPCMSLCSECFLAADHIGHDFNMFKSQAGGACDCGDENVMDLKGFCSKHCKNYDAPTTCPPKELLDIAEIVVPRVLTYMILLLRYHHGDCKALLPLKEMIAFVQQLSDMGTIMQRILCSALCDESLYKMSFKKTLHEDILFEGKYKLALESTLSAFKISDEFPELSHLDQPLVHTSLLDEIFFWTIKYKFMRGLVTFVLGLLPNVSYKLKFVKVFMKHYTCAMYDLCQLLEDKSAVSNAIVHISVQLLSPMHLAVDTIKHFYLMQTMLTCLKHIIKPAVITKGGLFVVDCSQHSFLKEHCYWPIVTDVVNVLSHSPVIEYFLSNIFLISKWADIVSYFQGMNRNKREILRHVEYEPDGYYQAFSAELEICSTPLWTMLMHLQDESQKVLTQNIVQTFYKTVENWLSRTTVADPDNIQPGEMSFHYPLHRYLSLFISNAIQKQGFVSKDLLPSDDFLEKLLIHPLHLLVSYNEINCGMWVRNGQQIKGQAMFYTHWNFASSTMDPDYFLIQVIASRLDPDEILTHFMEKFRVLDVLSIQRSIEKRSQLLPEYELPMMEACLYFIAALLSIRVLSGDIQDLIPSELISLLCVADRTHSQLTSSIPDRCGSHNPEWINGIEAALPLVSEFKPPIFEVGTVPQQGKYLPLANVWIDKYDPLFVKMRTLYKKDFQASHDRYCDFIKQQNVFKENSQLWPPFRLPKPIHPSLTGLYHLVHCSTMHAMIFTQLYKATTMKTLPESIIYLTIHLLELAITLPNDQIVKKKVSLEEFRENSLSTWFTSNSIFDNAQVMVTNIKGKISSKSDNEEDSCFKKFTCLLTEATGQEAKTKDFTIPINESIITLLIKLFLKFSNEPYLYDASSMKASDSRVGSGKFFIKKVLDKLCTGSRFCANQASKWYQTEQTLSENTLDEVQDRRLKAKLRQQRLLSDFASKQKKFMEEALDDDGSNTEEVHNTTNENDFSAKVYDCCICNLSAPSTSTQPFCIPARVSPTSILGHCIATNEGVPTTYLQHIKELNEILLQDFKMVPEICWYKTSQLQTCGHSMHLNCYIPYVNSLQYISNQTAVLVEKGEFCCPMCRQISNTILPLIEKSFSTTQYVPNEPREIEQIQKLLEVNLYEVPEDSILSRSIALTVMGLERNSFKKPENNYYFFTSVLRNNLELHLIKTLSKSRFTTTIVTRKSCIYPLYVVLSISSKKFSPNFLPLLWKHVTTSNLSRSFEKFDDVPLVMKEVSDIFIQFLLGLPFNLDEKQFLTLVRVLYNVNLIQLIICIVCNSTPQQILSWKKKVSEDELDVIVKSIIDFIDSSAPDVLPKGNEDAFNKEWTTLGLRSFLMEHILPYLRMTSLAHHCIYAFSNNMLTESPYFYSSSICSEFVELCAYLHLDMNKFEGSDKNIGFVGLSPVESTRLTEKLCNDIEYLASSNALKTKDLVKCHRLKWDVPNLIHLPNEFDSLFQFYRKETCIDCLKIPKYPALCLVCGKLICYNELCCSKDGIQEFIWHSLECGNGTGLYLGIDSSLVLIVQNPRVAFWGSVYLDKHGEEDKNLRRGKPLYLNKERYDLLNHMWLTHSLDQLCKQWTFEREF